MATKENLVQMTVAVILVFITLQSVLAVEFYYVPLWDKTKANMTIADLCVNGKTETCTKLTMQQVTAVCGVSYLQDGTTTPHNYTGITEAKCNGTTCHVEISTNSEWYHTGLDCIQNGTTASCVCQPYEKVKRKQ
ncbi:hypothetical protein WDU94_002038 [Cyamophila willieti]